MIEIQDLRFTYNIETTAETLRGISAVIHEGEFLAVLGHNGCGKSTLAKHLNALLLPQEGKITVDGMDTRDEKFLWEIRKRVGMVFQNPDNQLVATVVEEEMAFGPENLGLSQSEIKSRIESSLESAGISSLRLRNTHHLSGGQKQRLAIAGIMAMQPRYIVLDESTSMLDPQGRKDVLNTIHKLNKEKGITVIAITHIMEEVVPADRVLVMEEGKIVLEGTPRFIFSQVETMKNLRLDVPPMTQLAYRLGLEGIPLPADLLTLDEMTHALLQLK